jgi:hypothetical protein
MGHQSRETTYEVLSTTFRRLDGSEAPSPEDAKKSQGKVEDGRKWAGYNPAVEAHWITEADLSKVKSRKQSTRILQGWKPYNGTAQQAHL